jgi:rhamnosyl/mannosyltransferase
MKILEISKLYFPWVGGVEKIVRDIAEKLNGNNGIVVEVLVCNARGRGFVEDINGIRVHRVASAGVFWGMPVSFGFLGLFKKLVQRYDLIFLHHPFPTGMIAYLLFGRKRPFVIWYHSDIVRQKVLKFLFSPVVNATLKRARSIIVSNPNLAKSAVLARYKEKCVIIPPGVEISRFELTPQVLQEIKKIRGKFKPPIVLSVGRFVYYKGFEYLIRAAETIDSRFIIIGNGPLRSKLEALILELGLENKVFLLTSVTDSELISYYHACEVFVLPSVARSEAFGLVILEAMACGKPVVSTELGTGTSWVNENGKTGIVVPPKNVGALADAIKNLLSDPSLRAKLGTNATAKVRSEFTLDRMRERLLEILREASASSYKAEKQTL